MLSTSMGLLRANKINAVFSLSRRSSTMAPLSLSSSKQSHTVMRKYTHDEMPSVVANFTNADERAKFEIHNKKWVMMGLGCSLFIELCAEAMFFKKVSERLYQESLEIVRSSLAVQQRIGTDIMRKGDKFGVFSPTRENGRKIRVAHYHVQGDKGDAKVILYVEKCLPLPRATLLSVEFSNFERLTLLEEPEEEQQESTLPAL